MGPHIRLLHAQPLTASQKRIDTYEARVAESRLAEVRWRTGKVGAFRGEGLLSSLRGKV